MPVTDVLMSVAAKFGLELAVERWRARATTGEDQAPDPSDCAALALFEQLLLLRSVLYTTSDVEEVLPVLEVFNLAYNNWSDALEVRPEPDDLEGCIDRMAEIHHVIMVAQIGEFALSARLPVERPCGFLDGPWESLVELSPAVRQRVKSRGLSTETS